VKRITTIAAISIVAGLTLSGCGLTAPDTDTGTSSTNSPSDTTKGSGRKGG
jgi:hypothetical protein